MKDFTIFLYEMCEWVNSKFHCFNGLKILIRVILIFFNDEIFTLKTFHSHLNSAEKKTSKPNRKGNFFVIFSSKNNKNTRKIRSHFQGMKGLKFFSFWNLLNFFIWENFYKFATLVKRKLLLLFITSMRWNYLSSEKKVNVTNQI